MQTILVLNSKGGSGKSTVATNLASYYAGQEFKTALMDYDPQGSSLQWLKLRPVSANSIHGANAAKQKTGIIRSWKMNVPTDTEKLIIDVPAGVEGLLLQETVRKADCIVIPVGPSSIDVHATADFIRDLLLIGKVRQTKTQLAVLANRVRASMPIYEPLERFLTSLKLPFVTRLSDSDNYIHAYAQGLGIHELDRDTGKEREEFQPLINWLSNPLNKLVSPKLTTAPRSINKVAKIQPLPGIRL
ncbi:MAG: ParA family protein [Gammaproteobacteria bacterium]|nr:ParA family protein [Gammaproteobacteria bacterium]MDH5801203.1 ParA family protein [Gammaproteobacteria bacterium]